MSEALGSIGPVASKAVPALAEALRDEEGIVRTCAAEALWKIARHPNAIGQLVAELEVADEMAQRHAAEAIGAIGPDAKQAVPALGALLTHRDFGLRRAADLALQKINPGAVRQPEKPKPEKQ